MIALAKTGKYRVYALDFWGFGDSAKSGAEQFKIESYVSMVHQFMETLGIVSAPIAGHSMGGTVALSMALAYPDRVDKVAVVGSPIDGRTLNPLLQLAGYNWVAELTWKFPSVLNLIMRSLLAGDSKKVQSMIFRDLQRASMESFFRSIGDLRDTDLRPRLSTLGMPTFGIYGSSDNIVSPKNAGLMTDELKDTTITIMSKSRHFPMADEPEKFVAALQQFLSYPSNNHQNGAN
jgi:pimeloyl-ACP methyl ester carboxylesterase